MTVNRDQAHSGTALGREVNALRFAGIDIGKAAYPSAVALLADWKAERLYRIALGTEGRETTMTPACN